MVPYQLPLSNYLIVSAILFVIISVAGIIINRGNLIVLLMCIELMLLSVNTNFVAFATYGNHIAGEIFVFFILTVAAAGAIGLAIVIIYFRQKSSIDMSDMNVLKG